MSAGMRSSSTSRRTKSKSAFDAAGKPTSISLTPSRTSRSNIRCLRAGSIGLDEGLVPVAQVGRAPDRRVVDDAVGPGAVGQVDGLVRAVLPERHGHAVDSSDGRGSPGGAGTRTGMSRDASPTGEGGGRAQSAETRLPVIASKRIVTFVRKGNDAILLLLKLDTGTLCRHTHSTVTRVMRCPSSLRLSRRSLPRSGCSSSWSSSFSPARGRFRSRGPGRRTRRPKRRSSARSFAQPTEE